MSDTYLRGKYKGQLKLPAIRRLVRAHNKASKIVITKLNYEQTLEKLKKEGYTIDHEKKKLISNKVIDLPPKKKRVMTNQKKKDTSKPKPKPKPKPKKITLKEFIKINSYEGITKEEIEDLKEEYNLI